MKYFTAIMACYLLVLSLLPCRDRQRAAMNSKEMVTISALTDAHPDNQPKTDACTPFCTCSHCPASAFFQPVSIYSIPKIDNRIAYIIPDLDFISHEDQSIWQPPQLS